jgi:zinc transporter 2
MSVGVCIAATIIYFKPEYRIADPICTYLFSVIVLCTTIPVVKECTFVLLEGSPDSIDIEEITTDLLNIEGVVDMHDFHIWAISVNKFSLSAHMTSLTPLKTLGAATNMLRKKYNLFHTTIQVESVEESKYYFKCEHDLHE